MALAAEFRNASSNQANISITNTPLSNAQGETSSLTLHPTPSTISSTRHYNNNTISTSNLGMDTPSTARSTHSSALPSPSLSPIIGVASSSGTNQFDNFFADHTGEEADGDDITVDEPVSHHENWNVQQTNNMMIESTHSLWDLNTMLATFDALPSSMKSYMLFQLLRRCRTITLQYVSNIILPAFIK